ncbi:MAG: hypothetical protein HQ472_03985 [Ignavibacteria bacterium]|nr:hypothetical protein [Ignavibacteria bacterium]
MHALTLGQKIKLSRSICLPFILLFVPVICLAQNFEEVWHPQTWNPCSGVLVPWRSSSLAVLKALAKKTELKPTYVGSVTSASLSYVVCDSAQPVRIEFVFDGKGKLQGASWTYTGATEKERSTLLYEIRSALVKQNVRFERDSTEFV